MNRIVLIGNLTKDPEIRATKSGKKVALFTIGVRRNMPNQSGQYESDFINVVAFRGADYIEKYISKGNRVAIEGRLQTRISETEKGKRYFTEVMLDEITNLTPKQNAQKEITTTNDKAENKKTVQTDPFEEFGKQLEIDDNALPF